MQIYFTFLNQFVDNFSCPDTPASPHTHHLSFSSNEGLQVSFPNVGLWLLAQLSVATLMHLA